MEDLVARLRPHRRLDNPFFNPLPILVPALAPSSRGASSFI